MVTNATNSTTNYGLPLFVATDKPAWLIDWNNTMNEIDKDLKAIADAGDNTQILEILGDENSGLIHDVAALQSSLATATQDIQTNAQAITAIQGAISTIQSDLTTQNGLIQNLDTRVTALENA